jgi:regulator of sigma E protease
MGLPGIVKTINAQAKRGLSALLGLLAVLSINLGLFNLLPIPALDGSRLTFLAIEGVRRRPVDVKIENIVHTVGFVALISLLVFVSVRDLFH